MSNFNSLKIELVEKEDRYNQSYHVGKLQAPSSLSFRKGVALFVFLSENDAEELHIGCAKPDSRCESIRRVLKDGELDHYVVDLKKKTDQFGNVYYMSVVQDDLILNLEDGYVFFVFSSQEGKEQLQIKRNKEKDKREPEIYRLSGNRGTVDADPYSSSFFQ